MTAMIEANPQPHAGYSHAVQAGEERKTRIQVDWKLGAKLLVEGKPPAEVAAALGIDEERLWKQLAKSLRFQTHIRRAMDRARLLTRIQSGTLQNLVMRDALNGARDAGSLQWLDEAMRKPDPAGGDAHGEDALTHLSATGRRGPNQAQAERFAEEKRWMDIQVEYGRRALSALKAEQATANKSEQASNKTQQAPNKPEQASAKPEQAADKPEQAFNRPAQAQPQAQVRPQPRSGPVLIPRHPGPPRRNPTIVDLTDMQGRPLDNTDR